MFLFLFFSIWVFFHNDSWITGLQGKGEGIASQTLDISQAITAESSPLHIGSSRTWIGILWFLSTSCSPLSYAPLIRPRQHSLAVLASSTSILSLLVFIYAIFCYLEVHMPRTCPKPMKGNYGGISLCCFKFLFVEFGENLD